MMIPSFDYLRQYASLRGDIEAALNRVLQSGMLILGEEVSAFEERFASACDCGFGIGVNSGTDALHLALRAAGVQSGDEVITVPNTAVATVSAICSANARPVFVDIEEDSCLIDVSRIEAAITPRTRVIMPVHLFGQMADMKAVGEIARRHSLLVIEDCAQAHGARWENKPAGSFGDIGCYSFYPTKNLAAYGDGGMAVTNNASLAEKIRLLRNYGFEERDRSVLEGFNSRLDELQAAVLSVKLPYLEAWNNKRRSIAAWYSALLGQVPVKTPQEKPGCHHTYHLYVIRSGRRDALRAELLQKKIMTGIHYPVPIHLQPAYRFLGYDTGSFPIAERVQQEIVSLPMFPELTREEVEVVCRAIASFHGSR